MSDKPSYSGSRQRGKFYVGLFVAGFLFGAVLGQLLALFFSLGSWWLPVVGGASVGFLVYLYVMRRLGIEIAEAKHQLDVMAARATGRSEGMVQVLQAITQAPPAHSSSLPTGGRLMDGRD